MQQLPNPFWSSFLVSYAQECGCDLMMLISINRHQTSSRKASDAWRWKSALCFGLEIWMFALFKSQNECVWNTWFSSITNCLNIDCLQMKTKWAKPKGSRKLFFVTNMALAAELWGEGVRRMLEDETSFGTNVKPMLNDLLCIHFNSTKKHKNKECSLIAEVGAERLITIEPSLKYFLNGICGL